jgi:hypothetical protein
MDRLSSFSHNRGILFYFKKKRYRKFSCRIRGGRPIEENIIFPSLGPSKPEIDIIAKGFA